MANLLYQQIEMLTGEAHRTGSGDFRHRDAMVVAPGNFTDGRRPARKVQCGNRAGRRPFGLHSRGRSDGPEAGNQPGGREEKNPDAEIGTEILTAKPTDVLGRIAAQTAKQVILQKVREAERDTI